MIKTIDIQCEVCGKVFSRREAEHNRNLRKNRRVYCSRKCQGTGVKGNLPKDQKPPNLLGWRKNDPLSQFRQHHRSIQLRCKENPDRKYTDLTLEDLRDIWDRQGGICPYTGWELVHAKALGSHHKLPLTPNRASVDRIDSSKGYVKENVQYIAFIANMAKNVFTEDQLKEFCFAVARKFSQNDCDLSQ